MLKITDEMREAARRLLLDRHDASDVVKLEAIADGKRKRVDHSWWKQFFADIDRAKLDRIARMADPALNDKEHERAVAASKLATFKARRAPGMPPQPPPLPKSAAEWIRRVELKKQKRKKTKTTSPSPQASRRLKSDSVADPVSVETSDSVARLKVLNKQRAAKRAAKRANLKCQTCGKPLAAAQRVTARYCNATCRSQAWRRIAKENARGVVSQAFEDRHFT